jgi:tetratricopeptide (TPR) repeat protein
MGRKRRNRASKGTQPILAQPGSNSSSLRNWIIGLILGVTFLAFVNTLGNGFAYDDDSQILKNQLIRSWSNIPTAMVTEVWFFRVQQDTDPNKDLGPTTPYYRPMFVIYLMVGWHLFGTWAPAWHLASVLMHMAAIYFAFLILEKITKDLRVSAIATLLFAIHPLRSESVAWISGVTDLFLALFLLPSFFFYMRYRECGQVKHLIAAMVLFILAAFSKEPAVCLPIFTSAYEILIINQDQPLMRRIKSALAFSLMLLIISMIYFSMRRYALGFWFNDPSYVRYSTAQILMTIPLVIWKYIGLLLWPVNLSLYHATYMVNSPMDMRFIFSVIGLILLCFALWPLRRSLEARFAALWFVINLLPVLNLGAFDQSFNVQERYVYIPSIGFSLLVAMALIRLPVERWLPLSNRNLAKVVVIALICLLLAGKTLAQNAVWKDDQTLFTHGAEVASDQIMSHIVLFRLYMRRQQVDKVIEELEKVVTLAPDNPVWLSNLAAAHTQMYELTRDRAHLDRAIALCEKGLSIDERNTAMWDTLGHVYTYDTELRNYHRAREFFARAIAAEPRNAMAQFHMGATYLKEGDAQAAIRYLETARQLQPEMADVYKFLSYAHAACGQIRQAIDSLNTYLEKAPNAADAAQERKHLESLQARLSQGQPQG